jgi:hypothetical protein
MKIYVASSWRNTYQPDVVATLRSDGHEVYDFRNPAPNNTGFSWSLINPHWHEGVTPQTYLDMLTSPIAEKGFRLDMDALRDADACVMVMPCGMSAGIEFGYAVGAGIPTAVYIPGLRDPDLMIKMADVITLNMDSLRHWLHGVSRDTWSMIRFPLIGNRAPSRYCTWAAPITSGTSRND